MWSPFNDNIVQDNLIHLHYDVIDDANVQDDVSDVTKYGKLVKISLILVLLEKKHLRAIILTKLMLGQIYLQRFKIRRQIQVLNQTAPILDSSTTLVIVMRPNPQTYFRYFNFFGSFSKFGGQTRAITCPWSVPENH